MSDDHPSSGAQAPRSFLERLGQAFAGEPRTRAELVDELRAAQSNGLMSQDTLAMIEGAFAVSDQQVSDVMVPRAHMVCVPIDATLAEVLDIVVESGHSRFPVTGEDRDEVLGILLAKDLLRLQRDHTMSIDLRSVLRPVSLIPESKRLEVLLKEFRQGRRHMAVVVDEYGGVAGLVTIEDVDSSAQILEQPDGGFLIAAQTPIEEFNARFGTEFSDEDFDTVGGLITDALGHLPKAGETVDLGEFTFAVTKADNRRLIQLAVQPRSEAA
jgi:magnesium and cobalt transporter